MSKQARKELSKSSSFLLTMAELKDVPYTRGSANLGLLSHWLINYLQWPSLVLIGGALAVGSQRLKGRIFMALAAGAGPLAFMALAARAWFSRYAVMAVPFVVLAVGLARGASESHPFKTAEEDAAVIDYCGGYNCRSGPR